MSRDDQVVGLFRRAAADRERGAAEIEETLIRGLLESGIELHPDSLHEGSRVLVTGQPSMANLRSMAAVAERATPEEFSVWLEGRWDSLHELPKRFAAGSWHSIEPAELVVTVSRSTAVAAVVEGAWSRGWKGSVVVFDGSESGRGSDLAVRLSRHGQAVSQPDAVMPEWLAGDRRVVVAGADAVGPGSFLNSVGTRLLFELARDRGIERLVVADTGKDVSRRVFDELVDGIQTHRDSQGRSWPIFEVIPLHLVSTRISEHDSNS